MANDEMDGLLVEVGERIGDFEVVEHMGLQGLADRYVGRDEAGREVMLGVVPAQHPGLADGLRDILNHSVHHPNLVELHDVLEFGRLPVLVTELVRAKTLRETLDEAGGGLPTVVALGLFQGLVEGVGAAHDAGRSHRDLRPENVLVAGMPAAPVARVLDLGVAAAVFDLVAGPRSVTTSGSFLGKPHYWAPERARRPKKADHRADLFSLGCILYELFAGQGPFAGLNLYDCYHATLQGTYAPLSERARDVPDQVLEVIPHLLAPDLEVRLQSTQELLERVDLFTLAGDSPVPISAMPATPAPIAPRMSATPSSAPRTPTHVPAPPKRPSWALPAAILVIVVIVVGAAVWLIN